MSVKWAVISLHIVDSYLDVMVLEEGFENIKQAEKFRENLLKHDDSYDLYYDPQNTQVIQYTA